MKNIYISLFLAISIFVFPVSAQDILPIGQVQGNSDVSPFADKEVNVQGVVTAVGRRGFYIQTLDAEVDSDPETSEGIYVFTLERPAEDITRGKYVRVTGTVLEFRRENDLYALFLTQIVKPEITVISADNPLPMSTLLTQELLNPTVRLDQLERFEGMRIKIDELLVTAPTGGYFDTKEDKIVSDGVFYGVLDGTPRPFREPGIDAIKIQVDKLPETLPAFDMNPESIRVDSKGLEGNVIDVTSGASIKDIVGIIDYSSAAYTILIDPNNEVSVANNRAFVPASPAARDEVTVASFNLENFFDDEINSNLAQEETRVSTEYFERRLKKASLAIRNVVSMPDVLGVIEVENLEVLKKLADRINLDSVAAGSPDPKYAAVLMESNDPRGIDVGFLVKTAKVKVVRFEQLAKDIKLEHPDAPEGEMLFSRPPILAEFEVPNESPENVFKFTVIVNHFKSYNGIAEKRVQDKKRMQAEFLAEFVSERETSDTNEKLILIGDFNSFQFNDGYNDLIGTLKGEPDTNVISPTETKYQTGMLDLVDFISPENRYSYIFGGSAQVLDHILVNKHARAASTKFGFARLNADFPKVYSNDDTRPERLSDHDVPVLYLSKGGSTDVETKQEVPEENKETPVAVDDEDRENFQASLFYSFDDKNSVDIDVSSEDWKNLKVSGAFELQTECDIFDHKAGGPNGAEWNPAGDLYLLIKSVPDEGTALPEVSINGTVILDPEMKEIESGKTGNSYYWLRLPVEIWMENLRDITEADFEGLFGKDLTAKAAAGEIETATPLRTGKIIEFEIRHGDKITKKYFHAAFGE